MNLYVIFFNSLKIYFFKYSRGSMVEELWVETEFEWSSFIQRKYTMEDHYEVLKLVHNELKRGKKSILAGQCTVCLKG